MARRMFKGNAAATTLASPITNASTSFTVVTNGGATHPDGSTGPFVETLDFATPSGEEKVLCSARSGDVFTILTRGYDGTTATSHAAGAAVRHTISAVDLDEANAHLNDTSRDDHTQYALVKRGLAALRGAASRGMKFHYGTDSGLLGLDDGTAWHDFQDKASADAAYASITAEDPWTSYTPTVGGVTLGNGAVVGKYRKTGKTLHIRMVLSLGTTSSVTGAITLTLPSALNSSSAQVLPATVFTGGSSYLGAFSINGSVNVGNVIAPTSSSSTIVVNADATHPGAWSATGNVVITGTLEVS